MSRKISRAAYADMFGPTTGDKVRLADTSLIVEVEKDFTTYGEEVKFGGGKVIRDGMGQSQVTRARGAVEVERRVGLGEMVVRADLDRPVAGVGDGEGEGFATLVQGDLAGGGEDFAGKHDGPLS